jgi:putrescine aminotransferase
MKTSAVHEEQEPAPMRTERQRLAESKAAHNHPVYATMAFVMGCGVQGEGRGSYVVDEHGRSFLALFDQYGNQSFGYSHERIVAAVREQLDTGRLNSTKIMFEREQIWLTERLAGLTGGRLPYAYLANSGGETIDNALKLARAATGRSGFVTAVDCFHGKTFAALSASGRPEHAALFSPFLERFTQVPFGDLAALERAVDGRTAAVLLEPVQAEGGVIVPPPEYLREVRRLCTEAGALLILDEMQTAFGRCGTFFAFEHFGITPDLICVGKAFGGGLLPISAVIGTEAVWQALRALPSTFGSSLGGNPLSCRVGLEAVEIASEPGFLQAVRDKAEVLDQRLAAMAARFPELVRAHRGIGMMHGLEFHDEVLAGTVLGLLLEERVTSAYSLYNPKVLRVQPPLVISDADLDHGLDILEKTLGAVGAHIERLASAEVESTAPITRVLESERPAPEVLALLRARPRLLDPFALRPEAEVLAGVDPRFAGTLGHDLVVWADRVEQREDGVALSAEPCWLWRRLERTVSVLPAAAGSGCTVRVHIDWDTGSGSYEDLLGGRIGFFIAQRLAELPTLLEASATAPQRS